MHLIRLLSVSDTFTAGEIPVGRYHVVGLKVLPRFTSAGMAVRAPVRPTRRWQGSGATTVSRSGEREVGLGNPAAEGLAGVAAQVVEAEVKAQSPGVGPVVKPERAGWWGRAVLWLVRRLERSRNPFGGSGLRVAKTVRPRQGTLSLEAVQVVCNDLKDSDFELVPAAAKRKAKGLSGAAESVACDFQGGTDKAADRAQVGGGRL